MNRAEKVVIEEIQETEWDAVELEKVEESREEDIQSQGDFSVDFSPENMLSPGTAGI